MLHIAAGIYDLQHKFQKENPEEENDQEIMSGETSLSSDQGPTISNSVVSAMVEQKPPGIETQSVIVDISTTKEVFEQRQNLTDTKGLQPLEGKVQQLLTMDHHTNLTNSERARGEEGVPQPHFHPKRAQFLRQDSPDSLQDIPQHHQDLRSCSPESQMSDLHRSFASTPSLDESPTEVKDELVFEDHQHPTTRASLSVRTSHHDSLMTDSGIYDHDLVESDSSDSLERREDRFADGISVHEQAGGHEGKIRAFSEFLGAVETTQDTQSQVKIENAGKTSSPTQLQDGSESSHDGVNSIDLSWYDSASSDFYISSTLRGSGSDIAEFNPAKQGHYIPKSNTSPKNTASLDTQQRKKMVMYIEEPKRKLSTVASFNTDEDELAAYIYDPQINDSYNTCLNKGKDFLENPFVELHRRIERETGQHFRGSFDPLEDPNFAMPSSPSPLFVPPEYDEGKDDEFFMQVVSPFGDVTSPTNGVIDYKFEMHDATWGVSSGEVYFDLLTGQRILSTIYEFEVSSEEDADSFRMTDSRASHVDDFARAFNAMHIEEESFRRDSLEDNRDLFSLDVEKVEDINSQDKECGVVSTEMEREGCVSPAEENKQECIARVSDDSQVLSQSTTSLHNLVHSEVFADKDKDDDCTSDFPTSHTEVHDSENNEKEIENTKGKNDSNDDKEKLASKRPCDSMGGGEVGETHTASIGGNESDISRKDKRDEVGEGDTSSLSTDGANEKFTLVKNEADSNVAEILDREGDRNVSVLSKHSICVHTDVSDGNAVSDTPVVCPNEETPDIAIIVTTAEDDYGSDEEFFASDTFITSRDHYKCNEDDGCLVDSCACNNAGKDTLNLLDVNYSLLSDDDSFLSDTETDVTYISNFGQDFADALHISDSEIDDGVHVSHNEGYTSDECSVGHNSKDMNTQDVTNVSSYRPFDNNTFETTSGKPNVNGDVTNDVNLNDVEIDAVNSKNIADDDARNGFNASSTEAEATSGDCETDTEGEFKISSINDKRTEALVTDFSNIEVDVVSTNETEALVTNIDSKESEIVDVSNTDADGSIDDNSKANTTNSNSYVASKEGTDVQSATGRDNTDITEMNKTEKIHVSTSIIHDEIEESAIIDEIFNPIFSSQNGEEQTKPDETFETNSPAVTDAECVDNRNTESDISLFTASGIEEKQPTTNTIHCTDEIAGDLHLPPGGVARPVNVCFENLIVQENILAELSFKSDHDKPEGTQESVMESRMTSGCRKSITQRTNSYVEEECERMQMNIGCRQKSMERDQEKEAFECTVNERILHKEVDEEGFSYQSLIDEEFEICVPAIPPPKPRRLYLRRFSSEPRTSDNTKPVPIFHDVRDHASDPDMAQSPIKPKRRKRSPMCPVSPPRKNKVVTQMEIDACIENVTSQREEGESAVREKQSGENLEEEDDDGGAGGDSRSSSLGVETHGETRGKQAGTGPEPRDPGSLCLGLNIKQSIPDANESCDAHQENPNDSHEIPGEEIEHNKDGEEKLQKDANTVIFDKPIGISEIVASIVMESHMNALSKSPRSDASQDECQRDDGSDSVNDKDADDQPFPSLVGADEVDALHGESGNETLKGEIPMTVNYSNISQDVASASKGDDAVLAHKNDVTENEVKSVDGSFSPLPPKRKKKSPPSMSNYEHQLVLKKTNNISSGDQETEDSEHPPKVPVRTYRRVNSLPRRPKSRPGMSPAGAPGVRKAVERSATTATCRPHTSNDLTFSVPEISSVMNYDPLIVAVCNKRASVILLEEPTEATERRQSFSRSAVSTPHVRKRHLSADVPADKLKSDPLRRKGSFTRNHYFSLPRSLVKKFTNHASSSNGNNEVSINCFPNPFTRKQKNYDMAYSPRKASEIPHLAPFVRSPSTGSVESFTNLFHFYSSMEYYDAGKSPESKTSANGDKRVHALNAPPQAPPRRQKKRVSPVTRHKQDTETKRDQESVTETSVLTERLHFETEVSQDLNENAGLKHEHCLEHVQDNEVKAAVCSKDAKADSVQELNCDERLDDGRYDHDKTETDPNEHFSNQLHTTRLTEALAKETLDDSGIGILQEDLTTDKPLFTLPPTDHQRTKQSLDSNKRKFEDFVDDDDDDGRQEQHNAQSIATPSGESLTDEGLRQVESEANKEGTPLQKDQLVSTPTLDALSDQVSPSEEYTLWDPPAVPLQTWAERQGLQGPQFPPLLLRHQVVGTPLEKGREGCESMEENDEDTPSPGPPVEPEKEESQQQQDNNKSQKREEDTRVQKDRCIEVYPETVRQRQRNMMTSSNKVDIKNWTASSGGNNDTLTSPSKVKKFLPSVKALRNQFETGKTNNNKIETNANGVNNGSLSRKSSSSNSSLASSTLEKTSSTNSLNSTNGSMENLLSSNIENSRPIDVDEPVEPIFSQFRKVDEELRELMSKPPSTTGWNPRPLLKRLYYVPDAPKHHSQGTTYINIEGYLEKLPSGRKKATFWNAWKRRYFVAKDGVLYYYQNPQTDKASMKMTLMGGKVECMEPSMVSVDDGSRDSKAGAMIGIDDGKGHYVVVRCSSKQEAERWRRALETHTVEDFASQYVQPWPIPTNPTLLRDTLIIDLGSSSVRAGVLASQATLPQVFLPSVVATERESRRQIWGFEALAPDVRSVSSIGFPVRPSHKISKYSVDLSAVSSLLQKAFVELKVDPKNYNVQLSVPRILNPNTQTELLRVLFDKYGVKSVNLTHQSILALYAYNVTSGIVVDIGERMDIVPVIDGYIVDGGVSRVPYGGYRILDHLRQFLYMRNVSLINEVESYIIRHVLENVCYCAHHYNTEKARCSNNPDNFEKGVSLAEYFPKDSPYESIALDFGRFQATEGLFNPDAWGLDHPGIHKLVHKAIMECSMDIRKEMSRSIFLAGGVTQLPGLVDRLTTEIDNLTPPAIRPKVHASPYRYHAAYIGACVLAESPAFTQSRITREDWNKQGSAALRKWSL